MEPHIFVVSGPSGSGKTSVVQSLLKKPELYLDKVITCTTRAPRVGEVNGKDYHFLSVEEFEKKVKNKEFAEKAQVFGNHYGTTKQSLRDAIKNKKNVVIITDVQGHETLKKSDLPVKSIFITLPTIEELEARLRYRNTDSEAIIQRRLSEAKIENLRQGEFDKVVFNLKFGETIAETSSFISEIIAPNTKKNISP